MFSRLERLDVILKAENRILRERLKGHLVSVVGKERALLARKAFGIPRKMLLEFLARSSRPTRRWCWKPIAQKFDFAQHRKLGCPRTLQLITALIAGDLLSCNLRLFRIRLTRVLEMESALEGGHLSYLRNLSSQAPLQSLVDVAKRKARRLVGLRAFLYCS